MPWYTFWQERSHVKFTRLTCCQRYGLALLADICVWTCRSETKLPLSFRVKYMPRAHVVVCCMPETSTGHCSLHKHQENGSGKDLLTNARLMWWKLPRCPGCITCVGAVPRGSSPIARQQQHNFGDLPSRSITVEHFGKCPELMSTCRATSQLPCLICRHHSCWGESLFPFVLAHPLFSQVFLCSLLSSAGGGSRLPLQNLYCWVAFPRGYAGRVNPKHAPLSVFKGSLACTGATGPDLQLVT